MIRATEEGTAFTIDVDDKQYLITAKHIVSALANDTEADISILKKSGWTSRRVRVFKCDDPVDIAVLVPSAQLTVTYPLEPTAKGMADGQDVYFVGFPYHSSIAYQSLPDVWGFIRKAVVSAFESHPDKNYQRIYLDGTNNTGFSGSPLVWRDLNRPEIEYKVGGVITAFIPDAVSVLKKKKELTPKEITPEILARGDIVHALDSGKTYQVEETDQLVSLNTGLVVHLFSSPMSSFCPSPRVMAGATCFQGFAATLSAGFLSTAWGKSGFWAFRHARRAVRAEHPITLAILRQDFPSPRSLQTLTVSRTDLGRPRRFPFARALRKPAFTRSTINDRSSSATAPKTVKTIFPAGVDVSSDSESETN